MMDGPGPGRGRYEHIRGQIQDEQVWKPFRDALTKLALSRAPPDIQTAAAGARKSLPSTANTADGGVGIAAAVGTILRERAKLGNPRLVGRSSRSRNTPANGIGTEDRQPTTRHGDQLVVL